MLEKTNYKYIIIGVAVFFVLLFCVEHHNKTADSADAEQLKKTSFSKNKKNELNSKNTASSDSAAESLDTLTAELLATKKQIAQVVQDNQLLQQQNAVLLNKAQKAAQGKEAANNDIQTKSIRDEHEEKKELEKLEEFKKKVMSELPSLGANASNSSDSPGAKNGLPILNPLNPISLHQNKTKEIIPYYTIPANATSVHDKLMTALVGRIPIKGVVTDPYPFKIVIANDTLAANGLRVPDLRQMIVSGYSEGDLLLLSVRGWITSLTFVFNDGTISTTTSNDNNIGHFTKENALGYLSDSRGNPFIQGKLITNAPEYLGGNIALGAATGYAKAFEESQLTNQSTALGSVNSSVTGSSSQYALGKAGVSGMTQAQQWWMDRESQSFDAIFVSPIKKDGSYRHIVVNFAKQINIDYNPQGRKLAYEMGFDSSRTNLD